MAQSIVHGAKGVNVKAEKEGSLARFARARRAAESKEQRAKGVKLKAESARRYKIGRSDGY